MINVFFAPDTSRRVLPTNRIAHPDFPARPADLWTFALEHDPRAVTMTYRRGYLLDHSHERLSAEKIDGLELDVRRPGGRLNLEWWRNEAGWAFVRGWAWYPARRVDEAHAWSWIAL